MKLYSKTEILSTSTMPSYVNQPRFGQASSLHSYPDTIVPKSADESLANLTYFLALWLSGIRALIIPINTSLSLYSNFNLTLAR